MNAKGDAVELHPLVNAIAKSFTVNDGRLVMSGEDAVKHLKAVQEIGDDERDEIATHLVALAFRFKSQAAEGIDGAIGMLIAFTVQALGEEKADKAADMFASAGLGKEAANAIGAAQALKAPRADETTKPTMTSPKLKRGLKRE